MADAEARWVISLDAAPLQAGARSGRTALEQLRASIQASTKNLQSMQAAMKNLRGSAQVQRFDDITRKGTGELAKAQKTVEDLTGKLDSLREARETAMQARVSPGDLAKLDAQIAASEEKLSGAQAKVAALNGELRELENNEGVRAFKDLSAAAEEEEKRLAALQEQYVSLGGDLSKLGEKIEEPKKGVDNFAESAQSAGGPVGSLVGRLQQLKAAGPAGALAAAAVAIVAVVVAAVAGAAALVRFAFAAASAARDARILRSAAAGGSTAGLKAIETTMAAIRANAAMSREEAGALATDLYRAGMRGQALDRAALTIARFGVLGDETRGKVRALYDEIAKPSPMRALSVTADMLPRDQFVALAQRLGKDAGRALRYGAFIADKRAIADALFGLGETNLAGPAREQLLSLDKQFERARENLQGLFSKVNATPLLAGLQKILALLDESTATGKALRTALGAIFAPFSDAAGGLFPLIAAFLKGFVAVGLVVAIVFVKLRNGIRTLLGGRSDIDWVRVAFWGGVVAAGALLAVTLLLGAVVAALATAFLLLTAPIWLPFALAAAAVVLFIVAIAKLEDKLSGAFDGLSWKEAGLNLVNGLVEGIVSGVGGVVSAVQELASKATGAFMNATEQHSPSALWRRKGRNLPAGTALGIEDGADEVERAAEDLAPAPPDAVAAARAGQMRSGSAVRIDLVQLVFPGITESGDLDDETFRERLVRALAQAVASGGGRATVS